MQSGKSDPPGEALAHVLALLRTGKVQEAAPRLQQIVAAHPDNFEALRLSGILAHLQGQTNAAVDYLERALNIEPGAAETRYNLGVMLNGLGQYGAAVEHLERAIESGEASAEAYDALGSALTALKRYDEAIKSYGQAIELQPDFAEAYNNLGITLTAAKNFTEAATALTKAIELDPRAVDARINLGTLLNHAHEYEKAKQVLQEAIAINNKLPEAYNNLGLCILNLKDYAGALDAFNHAVALNPDHHSAFGYSALMTRRICDWSVYEDISRKLEKRIRDKQAAISPFVILAFSDDPALQLQAARNYTRQKEYDLIPQLNLKASKSNDRIRLAYISADFREHPVAHQIAELIETHDRDKFECMGISIGRDDKSDVGVRLRNAFDRYVNVRTKSNFEAARLIADAGVHIAVDLNGYTGDARAELFSHRPAPIQVNYLGYPCTMGSDFMDYIIVDETIAPPDQQNNFSENLVHLPDSYMVTDGKRLMVGKKPQSRSGAGLPEDAFVFCCFHNGYKITPDVFNLWMRLLKALPCSVLWLRIDDKLALTNLRNEAQRHGVDPERLVNSERVDMPDHMARHRLADIYLDTLPYNAHSSASDALMAGLPVVTCMGDSFASRVAASLLRAVDMPELITESLADYETLALKLAREPDYLSALHDKLARNRSKQALFDCARFTSHLELAYEAMFVRWQAGNPPAPITVEAIPQ